MRESTEIIKNHNDMGEQDRRWFVRIQQDDEAGFHRLFDRYYVVLCRFVHTLIEDEVSAEDVVQDIFVYIWERRHEIAITTSVRSYLFEACRHKALNHLRNNRRFTRFVPEEHEQDMGREEMDIETEELYRLIEEAVMSLPEKCGKIYRMSREEDLSHKEIAEREGITVKTVEAHLHKALKRLKKVAGAYLN